MKKLKRFLKNGKKKKTKFIIEIWKLGFPDWNFEYRIWNLTNDFKLYKSKTLNCYIRILNSKFFKSQIRSKSPIPNLLDFIIQMKLIRMRSQLNFLHFFFHLIIYPGFNQIRL